MSGLDTSHSVISKLSDLTSNPPISTIKKKHLIPPSPPPIPPSFSARSRALPSEFQFSLLPFGTSNPSPRRSGTIDDRQNRFLDCHRAQASFGRPTVAWTLYMRVIFSATPPTHPHQRICMVYNTVSGTRYDGRRSVVPVESHRPHHDSASRCGFCPIFPHRTAGRQRSCRRAREGHENEDAGIAVG